MDFSIWCPTDGSVEVGLDDIVSVVVRGGSDVEVHFSCPVCGRPISLAAQVPHALIASLEDGWVRIEGGDRLIELRREGAVVSTDAIVASSSDEARIEAYCEYFRRELEVADTVQDALSEIDAGETR